MDDSNGIQIFNGLKYGTYKILDTFWDINIHGDQNTKKKIPLRTRSFSLWMIHLKGFSPSCVSDWIKTIDTTRITMAT